jgi:hypothetical protein
MAVFPDSHVKRIAMGQQRVWLIVGIVSIVVVLLCMVVGVTGYLLLRDDIAVAVSDLEASNAPSPSPSAAAAADAQASPLVTPTATATPASTVTATPEPTVTATPAPSTEASPTVAATPAPSVEASPAASPAAARVVYEDDFSDPASGWYEEEDIESGISMGYADGAYRFVFTEKDTGTWTTHRSFKLARLDDVRIEVDVTQTDGYIEDSFGVICRANGDQFYDFGIGNDGWYGIGKMDGENYTPLTGSELEEEDTTRDASNVVAEVQTQEDGYRLRADCIGNTLTMYIDGEKVAEVQDDEFRSGGIGLTAYNYDAPRTEILFDNIVVSEP